MSGNVHQTELSPADTALADDSTVASALIGFSPDDYRSHLDGFEISDAEKDELLRLLWSIMCSFVDLGWGTDPVSLVFHSSSPAHADAPILDGDKIRSARAGV